MAVSQLIPSFNAGELSPYLDARSDLEKYASGCRLLENNIILPYGGAFRRPGTEYLGAAKLSDKRCRLLGFNFSTTTRFVIEAGELYLRFWASGVPDADPDGVLVQSGGVDLVVATPYLEGDLRELQFVQINDVMYFVHPRHEPRKLSRLADDDWTFTTIAWDWPALLDENVEATTIHALPTGLAAWVTSHAYALEAKVMRDGMVYRCIVAHTSGVFASDLAAVYWVRVKAVNGGTVVTLTASADIFEAGQVGAYFQIAHARENASVEQPITANGASASIAALGSWEITTYGTWTATVQIQRSEDNGTTWETIRSFVGKSDRNVSATGKESKAVLLRVNVVDYSTGSGSPRALLEISQSREYGVVKITGYTSATSVTAAVINALADNIATKWWAEGAWSAKRGFPRTVTLHEQRIFFGGTSSRPQSLWGSVVNDFENLRLTSDDDGGLFFTLSAQQANPIQWLISQDELLIGTAGDEWTLGSSDSDSTISPTNVKASRQSSYGSKYLRALIVNDVILFVQRQGRKVRELVYSFEKDGWVAPDLTVLSEHVTRGEIVECAFQQQPDAIYWTITGQGQLVGMTYERDQNVVGWHRHTTDGTFESVATIYGANGADEVWLAVRRTINGETKRYIERFRKDFRDTFEAEAKPDWWYLDCARRATLSPEGTVVTGLGHLESKTVDILADGAVSPSRTVTSGSITLQAPATKVLAGLRYVSQLRPMKLETQLQDGSSRGRRKRIHKMYAALHKSLGGEFSSDDEHWDWLYSRTFSDPMDDSPPVFTGDKEVYVASDTRLNADLTLRQTQPLPLTILALVPVWEASGA